MIDICKNKKINKTLKLKRKKIRAKYYKGLFVPDIQWKHLFKNLSKQKVIRIINELFSTDFDVNSNLEFIDTESTLVTGFEGKSFVKSDLIAKIFKDSKTDVDTIIIEFQSTKDNFMGYRMFIYSLNHSKVVIKNNEVYCEPAQAITIYSTFDKPLAGFDYVNIKQYDYEQVGMFKFKLVENDKYIRIKYPFINILAMLKEDLDSLDNTELDIFKVLYLYRYKKKKELLLKEDINDVIEKAKQIINKYKNKGTDLEVLVNIFDKLTLDIENILNLNKDENEEYGKVLKKMQTNTRGVTLEYIREMKAQAAAEAVAEAVAEVTEKYEKELAKQAKQAKQASELAAKQAAELAAKQAAELAAKQAAELAAKQAAEIAEYKERLAKYEKDDLK